MGAYRIAKLGLGGGGRGRKHEMKNIARERRNV